MPAGNHTAALGSERLLITAKRLFLPQLVYERSDLSRAQSDTGPEAQLQHEHVSPVMAIAQSTKGSVGGSCLSLSYYHIYRFTTPILRHKHVLALPSSQEEEGEEEGWVFAITVSKDVVADDITEAERQAAAGYEPRRGCRTLC